MAASGFHLASALPSAILVAHFGIRRRGHNMARMDRVSIRVETKVRKKVRRWAGREGIPPAELYRRLLEWAFGQYARAGTLAGLYADWGRLRRSPLEIVGLYADGERLRKRKEKKNERRLREGKGQQRFLHSIHG